MAELETRSCGALDRHTYNEPGWTCDGTGLMKLLDGPKGIPVVAPAWAAGEFLNEPWADVYRPEPFGGGDHYHWVRTAHEVEVSDR
jgi:hypothetical protein